MREAAEFIALFASFNLAGKRLRNRITHASMSLLATPAGRVTDPLIQYHANRAAVGAAMTVTEPFGMMRHQAGLPRVQVWRRDDADGLKRFAEAVETQDCRLLGQIQDAGRGRHFPGRNPEALVPPHCRTICRGQCHRCQRKVRTSPGWPKLKCPLLWAGGLSIGAGADASRARLAPAHSQALRDETLSVWKAARVRFLKRQASHPWL